MEANLHFSMLYVILINSYVEYAFDDVNMLLTIYLLHDILMISLNGRLIYVYMVRVWII